MKPKPDVKSHLEVKAYIEKRGCECETWARADHTSMLTKHHFNCDQFDTFCELQFLSRELCKQIRKQYLD